MITGELKSQVDKIWEAFWTGGISNPLSVIEQFTYLLFIRRLDERQLLEEKKANTVGIPIQNEIFTPEQKELRWSSFKNKDPESMFDLFTRPIVNDMTVFDHMKQVGHSAGVFADFMKNANFVIATPRLLDQVVQLIDKINMNDRDTKGDLYEYMLSKIASAGTNGQFRTPRHIIKMMVDMVQPKRDDVICDPASGTAGFLVTAGEYYRDNHQDWFLDKSFRDHFNNKMFNGVEIDDTMIRIGAMNLQLHGIESPNLMKNNALSESLADIRNEYTLILANPPFKGALDYDAVEGSILKTVKSKKTELLFLGLMLRMLKTGGRCAVIVPDGVLFGSSKAHKQIRQEIIENHKLDAIISMPSGVFKPYAGVSTAVLFFTKTGTGGTDTVWFYDMEADGYSLDDKRNEIKENDIPDVLSRYHNLKEEKDRARTDKSFLVPFEEIKSNDWDLSINRYKEIVYEEIEYASPAEIIKDIETIDQERNEALASFKGVVGMIELKPLKDIVLKPITGEWGSEGNAVQILRTTNFTNEGRLDYSNVVRRNIDKKKVDAKRLKLGDIIIEKSGGSPKQPVGRVVYFEKEDEFLCNNFTAVLRPKADVVNPKFLLYILFCNHKFGFTSAYQNKTTGIINLQLTKYLEGTKIPLPPLDQQKKIAAILDAADAYRQKTKALITKYEELTQSLFLEMFGDPVTNNKGQKEKILGELTKKITSGSTPKGGKKNYTDQGIPFLRCQNVWRGYFKMNDVAHIPESMHYSLMKSSLKHGDILMTKTGRLSTENSSLGRSAMYVGEDDKANISTDILLIRLKDEVSKVFISYILASDLYNAYLREASVGGTDKRHLYKKHLESLKIILPPFKLQNQFAEHVQAIEAQKEQAQASLAQAEDLFNSLLQRAFKGELVA